jgi:hypothetical protein
MNFPLSECQKGSSINAFERAKVRRRACPELEEYARCAIFDDDRRLDRWRFRRR